AETRDRISIVISFALADHDPRDAVRSQPLARRGRARRGVDGRHVGAATQDLVPTLPPDRLVVSPSENGRNAGEGGDARGPAVRITRLLQESVARSGGMRDE